MYTLVLISPVPPFVFYTKSQRTNTIRRKLFLKVHFHGAFQLADQVMQISNNFSPKLHKLRHMYALGC